MKKRVTEKGEKIKAKSASKKTSKKASKSAAKTQRAVGGKAVVDAAAEAVSTDHARDESVGDAVICVCELDNGFEGTNGKGDITGAQADVNGDESGVIDGEGKKRKKSAQKRDASGRFVKGSTPPKSPGRPRKPPELMSLMPESLKTIEEILKGDKTSDKLKFEAAKWVIEMNIGKPMQQVDASVQEKLDMSAVVLKFEGELDEWSG